MDNAQFPLVSVIMPIFNHEAYVQQALESILNQTYPNIEVILIDDGSRDASCRVIEDTLSNRKEKPGHHRDIHFFRQENQGAHTTINRGLSLAKGEWLTILNSDDYYDLKRIEIFIAHTRAANAEIAFSYVTGIDGRGSPLPADHWWSLWYEGVRCNLFMNAPTVGFCLLRDNFAVSTGNLFFSRVLYEKVGKFKNLKLMHDWDFLLRAVVVAEPLLVRDPLYFYRLHPHNTQSQVQNVFQEEQKEVYREYLCSVVPSPPENKKAPCHWYWPSEFGKWRAQLCMERGLSSYFKTVLPKEGGVCTKENESTAVISAAPIMKGTPITLISHELSLSGAPKVVADLALRLRLKGYEPRIIAMSDGPMRLELEKQGIPIYILDRSTRLRECLSSLAILCFRIKGQVIANSTMSWSLLLPMTLMKPWKKAIWYIHESFTPLGCFQGKRGKILSLLIKLSSKFSPPQLWFGSKSTQKAWTYTGLPEGEVMYWSGIPKTDMDKRHTRSSPADSLKHMLAVGTPSLRKGTHILIQAFLTCLKEKRISQDTMLTIVGFTDSENAHFLKLSDSILEAVNSEYRNNFHFISAVGPDALNHFFDTSDLFIQPSLQECLPLALLTAMSKGMPIITTDVDGCVEAITHKKTGYLCPPFDEKGLARNIEEAINCPEQSRQYGQQAQAVFNQKFALEITEEAVLKGLSS